jgi:predicted N-acetyltransferase YhbS
MTADDLDDADRIMRTAFGTFLGLPDPASFGGDSEYIRTRGRSANVSAFVAEKDAKVLGSNLVTRWGSFAFFGPLTVDPACWDSGIGSRLMEPIVDLLDGWEVSLAGLFTFPHSAKHIGLYHRYGFYPRALSALLQRSVTAGGPTSRPGTQRLSAVADSDRPEFARGMAELTFAVYPGLDLTGEIEELLRLGLGDVIVTVDDTGVTALAVCHLGAGTEAGRGTCYIKFGAVRPGAPADELLSLLRACDALAADDGAAAVLAGVNTARTAAYDAMLDDGFRPAMYGLAMHRPSAPGFSRPFDLVLDDWR